MTGRVRPEPGSGATPSTGRREVLSYVRRSGRMTPSQLRAWENHADTYVVDVPHVAQSGQVDAGTPPLDLTAAFGRSAELIVEIGPGMGDSLIPMAAAHPQANVLAFEVYHAGVAALIGRLAEAGADNVRVVMADAVSGLRHLLGPASITELWTFFPDPWPKARHHKRRLVSTEFADLVTDRLVPGGRWRLATDAEPYAEAMREVLDPYPRLRNEYAETGGWAPRWEVRPVTKFEARGEREGRTIRDLSYLRDDR